MPTTVVHGAGLIDDEYCIEFGKADLDARYGCVCPDNEHYFAAATMRIAQQPERRAVTLTCACGEIFTYVSTSPEETYAGIAVQAFLTSGHDVALRESPLRAAITCPDDASALCDPDPVV